MRPKAVRRFTAALLLFTAAQGWSCRSDRSESVSVVAGDVTLRAALAPAVPRVGENALFLELEGPAGAALESARVEASVTMPAMGAMPAMGGPASIEPLGGGRFRADFGLEMGGSWQIAIVARTSEGERVEAQGSLTVGTRGLRLQGRRGGAGSAEVPRAAGPPPEAEDHAGAFSFPPERLQRVGVRTGLVEEARLEDRLRAVGRVVLDERSLVDVSLKLRGWVGELGVKAEGDPVARGQVLLTVYIPELYAAQEELLQALRSRAAARETAVPDRADYLVRAARQRLRLWDVGAADVDAVVRRGVAVEYLPIRAPASGFAIDKSVVEGSAFEPGQTLFRIAPLDPVWVEADVYESELGLVREGQAARVVSPYRPGQVFEGRVSYVYPTLAGGTRTTRVRIELPNPELALRPDMYVDVDFALEEAPALVVPVSAVVRAGERSFVFRALGAGRFRPQEVQVGRRSGERLEVLSGLAAGDRIVTSGTFLIASESRLRAALDQW